MAPTRIRTWATRELHGLLLARAAAPFAWGSNDCCLFPADAILAMTGVDIAADFRGRYTTATGSLRVIRTVAGGKTTADAVAWCAAKHHLVELTQPRCAQRGDLVVLLNADGQEIAGLVGLDGRELVTVAEGGLVTFPIEQVKRAWRV